MYGVLQRYLMLVFAGLLLTLGTFWAVRYFQRPDMYPGDRIEERTCRSCGGSGEDKDLAQQVPELGNACRACGADGKVDVIIPGRDRPTKIAGVVIDGLFDSELATADNFRPTPEFNSNPEEHRKKSHTLSDVSITIHRSDGEDREVTSNEYGLFNAKLSPGRYTISARGEGFAAISSEIVIEPLTEPIWLEEAAILNEPGSEADARSMYGLNVLVSLVRPGTVGGRIQVTAGTP